MGPFYATRSNPTHQLTDSTQPNQLQMEKFGPNPTQPNTTNNGAYSLAVTYFYTRNISRTFSQPSHKIKFNCYTHTHPFNGPLPGTTRVSRYQKDQTNLDFTRARDSEWQWNPLGHMQVCTSHQTDNHASTPPLSFLQAGCHSCRPTNSVKALKTANC